MPLLISESHVNQTEGYRFGNSEPYEPFTEDVGELFRSCRREFGRCSGSVYVDKADGGVRRVGWVFEKTKKYEDTREPYVHETWVTLHDAPDTVTRQVHYHELKRSRL